MNFSKEKFSWHLIWESKEPRCIPVPYGSGGGRELALGNFVEIIELMEDKIRALSQ